MLNVVGWTTGIMPRPSKSRPRNLDDLSVRSEIRPPGLAQHLYIRECHGLTHEWQTEWLRSTSRPPLSLMGVHRYYQHCDIVLNIEWRMEQWPQTKKYEPRNWDYAQWNINIKKWMWFQIEIIIIYWGHN